MNLEGSRILVTGGGGFIGSQIIDQLIPDRPKEIIAFDRDVSFFKQNLDPDLDYKCVKFVTGDISRVDEVKALVKGVDFVFHTASLLTKEATGNLRTALDVNIGGTFNLLEGCVASGVKKVVYSSSVSVYGQPLFDIIREDHPFNIASMYGAGKCTSEFFLKIFKTLSGLDYVAFRYAVVYGARQHYRGTLAVYIPDCLDRIDKGLPPLIYGDGSQPYDYIYVADVARANIMAMKSPVTGEVFNLGSGVTITVKDLANLIVEVAGTNLKPQPAPQGDWFWQKHQNLDVSRAERILGFKAKISMKEGLKRYCEWRKRKAFIKG